MTHQHIQWDIVIATSEREDFWASSVEILVFASAAGYIMTSSGFPFSNSGIFYKFLLNDR
jgi:hypothetical protein